MFEGVEVFEGCEGCGSLKGLAKRGGGRRTDKPEGQLTEQRKGGIWCGSSQASDSSLHLSPTHPNIQTLDSIVNMLLG